MQDERMADSRGVGDDDRFAIRHDVPTEFVPDHEAIAAEMTDSDIRLARPIGHDARHHAPLGVAEERDAQAGAVADIGRMNHVDDRYDVAVRSASNQGDQRDEDPDQQQQSEAANDRHQQGIAFER